MKRFDIHDMFDDFIDEDIEIEETDVISTDRILKLTQKKIKTEKGKVKMPKYRRFRKSLTFAAVLAALCIVMIGTAWAVAQLMRPDDIVSRLYDNAAEQLPEELAKPENQLNITYEIDGARITLLSMATGEDTTLNGMDAPFGESTYIAVAMEDLESRTQDEFLEFANFLFHPQPKVSGYPEINVPGYEDFSFDWGSSFFWEDEVVYFIYKFPNLEYLADHTVYLAFEEKVYDGGTEIHTGWEQLADGSWQAVEEEVKTLKNPTEVALRCDEETGEWYFDERFTVGETLLIELPLDESKADPEKAELMRRYYFLNSYANFNEIDTWDEFAALSAEQQEQMWQSVVEEYDETHKN